MELKKNRITKTGRNLKNDEQGQLWENEVCCCGSSLLLKVEFSSLNCPNALFNAENSN